MIGIFGSVLDVPCMPLLLGVFILDLEATNMTEVVYRIVEELNIDGAIEEEQKSEIMRVLLYKHKYVSDHHHGSHDRHGHHGEGDSDFALQGDWVGLTLICDVAQYCLVNQPGNSQPCY